MECGRDSCALGSKKSRASPCLHLARLRYGHACCFLRQLVSHSPTHWITQDALLDMIDAIDVDMHARPGDAEQRNVTAYTQPLDRAVLRQLLLSFAHTAAQNADRPQHRAAGCRFIDWKRWSSVSFSQKQNVFWRPENCFHEAQPRNLTGQMPRPKPPTASQRRTCWSHWQMTTAATVTTHPLLSRNQRRQRHQRLPLLQ